MLSLAQRLTVKIAMPCTVPGCYLFPEVALYCRHKQGCGRACQPCQSDLKSCMLLCGSLSSGGTGRETSQLLKLAAWEMRTSCLLMKSLAIASSGSRAGLILHYPQDLSDMSQCT